MMSGTSETLYYQEEKLKFVIEELQLKKGEVAKELEISQTFFSQLMNYRDGKLKKWHLLAICHAYKIPIEIFDNPNIKTTAQIQNILKYAKKSSSIFEKNEEILNKLIGKWYFYSYSSQDDTNIWQTETTIHADGTVEDKNQNRGKLFIGKNQSVILKETYNAKNINTITFDNNRITYNIFPFSRTSKVNALNNELLTFGFCSKTKIDYEEAKVILGEYDKVQLKIEHTMLDRIYSLAQTRGKI